MQLKIRQFPCPKQLTRVTENVVSIDLGKHVGFAYVKGDVLYCGHYVLDVKEWRCNPRAIKQIGDEYKKFIDALLCANQEINLAFLEDSQYFFRQKYTKGKYIPYYKTLQIMVEGLFYLHWKGEIKHYFGGILKNKYFGTARKEIVKERIKKILGVSLCDHITDSIAGLFAIVARG